MPSGQRLHVLLPRSLNSPAEQACSVVVVAVVVVVVAVIVVIVLVVCEVVVTVDVVTVLVVVQPYMPSHTVEASPLHFLWSAWHSS